MHTRTKIICTIGPAVTSYEKMVGLLQAGMSVARLNFSHGTYEEHEKNISNLKKARQETGIPLAILLDTKGPKIRLGKLEGGAIQFEAKQKFRLVEEGKEKYAKDELPFHPIEVIEALHPGMKLLFDDGYIISKVVEVGEKSAVVEMQNRGSLKSGKGINIPGAILPLPALTPRDLDDLRFGCKHSVDLVAASFIRSSHHILSIKEELARQGRPDIPVIAKIESTQGVDHFDSIVQVADGIMIARGDLGVEIELELVPKLQKMMIRKCFQACKPAITATQMLESMITNPRPTRAEVSDVANAIYDCTSLIMLSAETAVGQYPIETVERMVRVVKEAESDFNYRQFFEEHSKHDYHDISSSVALAAVKTAYSSNAKAIFALTTSGTTARLVSRLRPDMPIIAVTPNLTIYHQLAFHWGIHPVLAEGCKSAREAFSAASHFAFKKGILSFGDVVVVTAGAPFGKKGTTNMMMVESIGEVLVRGYRGFGPKVSGKVLFVLSPEEKEPEELEGAIVVIPHCDNTFLPILKHAAGVVLQNYIGDSASEKYAALVARTFEISVITRADGAMSVLKEGEEVTLDPKRGLIYRGTEEIETSCYLMNLS